MSLWLLLLLLTTTQPVVLGLTTTSVRHVNQPSDVELVPVNRILGTDLYTGIFYQVKNKKYPQGFLTYTVQLSSGKQGNYLQIDDLPADRGYYDEGGKWFIDGQWFLDEESENGHVFKNRRYLKNPVTTQRENKANDKYLHLIIPQVDGVLNRIGPGGKSRDYVYMNVNQTTDQGPFQYRIKWYKYNKGIVVPAPRGVAANKYFIEIADALGKDPQYQWNGDKWGDTLFSFIPISSSMDMTGFLSYVKLKGESSTLLEKYQQNINVEYIKKNGWDGMDKSMATIDLSTTLVKGLNFSASFRLPSLRAWENDKTNLDINYIVEPFLLGSSSLQGATVKVKLSEGKEFNQLSQRASTQYIVRYFLSNVEFPFEGTIVFTANGDRLLQDYSGTGRGPLPPEMVMQALDKAHVSPEDNRRIVGDKVIVFVEGVLKGTFTIGYDVVEVDS